ncbi:hypothetical protein JCM17960_11350 [Magnetospira thiophila]
MTHLHKLLLAGAAALMLSATAATAETVKLGDLTIQDSWARASAGMARAGAAFMDIHNAGAEDKLIAAAADVSKVTELHTHIMADGIMRMRQVPDIPVPANGMVSLKPGSFHVMFMGLHAPLEEGQTFPVTLTFEKAGSTTIQVTVKSAGSMGMETMKEHGMEMKDGMMPGHK